MSLLRIAFKRTGLRNQCAVRRAAYFVFFIKYGKYKQLPL